MKNVDMNFIPQNVAPIGAKQVAIFDSDDNLVATLPLGGLAHKHQGEKKYSFGALSDVHLPYAEQNASTDFQKALTYFNNVANVDFICIAGDMSDTGTDAEWLDYKNHVDAYSPNTPVHMCTGNHDTANNIAYEYPIQYTGHPLWYSFTQGDDVFIMFGLRQWQGNNVFYDEALQWLYETLEENKDKRCFVFQHEMRLDGCGNAHGLYGWDGLSGRNGQVFLSLMEHYKNVIWFHGHSHTPFKLQSVQPTPIANYDRLHGCHSVHIPSLAIPRYGNSDVIFDAEGYVVDVYENGIHLRGIDFIEEEFVPIASYWIDTTPIEIPANSYVDTRGVIKERDISLPKGSELIMNQRYSYSGKGLVTDEITPPMFTAIIPVMPNTDYVLKIKNSNIEIPSASSSVVYGLDSSKMPAQQINGSGNIPTMTTGITLSEDKKSADITFTTAGNVSYIALSLKALVSGTLEESDIVNYIIELEQNGNNDQPENEISLPEGSELYINQRYSQSEVNLVTANGMFAVLIPVDNMTGSCTVKIKNSTIPLNVGQNPNSVIYALDSNKLSPTLINGGHISDMTEGITYSEDYKSADITFTLPDDCAYIALSLSVASGVSITAADIKEYIIEIEAHGKILKQGEITDSVTWTMDKRLSSAGDVDKDSEGTMVSDYILVNPNDVINIYGITSLDERPFYINFYKDENFVSVIPLSNANMNPNDGACAYAEYNTVTQHLTIRIKEGQSFNSIRVCCVESTVRVYRNAEGEELDPLVLPEGSELYLNKRYSKSGKGLQDLIGNFAVIIPIDGTIAYTLSLSNIPHGYLGSDSATLYKLDETKTIATSFNGSSHPINMTTGVTMSEDHKSATIEIPAEDATVHYLAFTCTVETDSQLTEEDLAGIVIDLNVSNV